MNFLARLRAMLNLGDALGRVAFSTRVGVVEADDEARSARLGDIDGQTERAQAFAKSLNRLTIRS